jgi:predicted GIY-YIG superfamily endonuclease
MGVRQKNVGCIYKITSPSNKIYIGQTIDIKTRLCKYKNMACNYKLEYGK